MDIIQNGGNGYYPNFNESSCGILEYNGYTNHLSSPEYNNVLDLQKINGGKKRSNRKRSNRKRSNRKRSNRKRFKVFFWIVCIMNTGNYTHYYIASFTGLLSLGIGYYLYRNYNNLLCHTKHCDHDITNEQKKD